MQTLDSEVYFMIDFNKLTNQSQEIVFAAQQLMSKFQNTQLEPAHIVMAMLEAREGISKDYMEVLKLDRPQFKDAVMSELNNLPRVEQPVNTQQLYLSQDTIKLFESFWNLDIDSQSTLSWKSQIKFSDNF